MKFYGKFIVIRCGRNKNKQTRFIFVNAIHSTSVVSIIDVHNRCRKCHITLVKTINNVVCVLYT